MKLTERQKAQRRRLRWYLTGDPLTADEKKTLEKGQPLPRSVAYGSRPKTDQP